MECQLQLSLLGSLGSTTSRTFLDLAGSLHDMATLGRPTLAVV
jgi:hypothetical protein